MYDMDVVSEINEFTMYEVWMKVIFKGVNCSMFLISQI